MRQEMPDITVIPNTSADRGIKVINQSVVVVVAVVLSGPVEPRW